MLNTVTLQSLRKGSGKLVKYRCSPDRFGNEGQWEDNARLCGSFVYKLHIRLPSEPPWKKSKAQIDRTSNIYLVYTRHWMDYDNIQIISIMAPDAHEKPKLLSWLNWKDGLKNSRTHK